MATTGTMIAATAGASIQIIRNIRTAPIARSIPIIRTTGDGAIARTAPRRRNGRWWVRRAISRVEIRLSAIPSRGVSSPGTSSLDPSPGVSNRAVMSRDASNRARNRDASNHATNPAAHLLGRSHAMNHGANRSQKRSRAAIRRRASLRSRKTSPRFGAASPERSD